MQIRQRIFKCFTM